MKTFNVKEYLPHIAAVVIFIAISLIYMSPLLEGKKISQSDIIKFQGMSKEIADFRKETSKEALWTNGMFSGMPAFQTSVYFSKNIANHVADFIRNVVPLTADFVFIYLLGFYLLLLAIGAGPWLSIFGAIAFAMSSYHFIIIEAGHTSKAYAIGYMAPVLAGFILTLRGKLLKGGILTAFFLAMQLQSNHLQITYYLLFILFFWGVGETVYRLKEKKINELMKSYMVLFAAVIIAVGVNFGNIWSTYVFSKHTMRGPSELTINQENKTSGLDKDYATAWSYGVGETFSLMIPNVKGGRSGAIGNNKSALENIDSRFRRDVAGQNHYWGNQPFTSGPVYVGAIVFFLFILSLFVYKNNIKWYILAVAILTIMLSWGKNFMPLTDFFLDYFPMYNKFRAVSMILVVAELCIPLLAFMGVTSFINKPDFLKENAKKMYIAFALTGGLAFIFYLLPTTFFSFFSQMELSTLNAQKIDEPAFAAQIDLFMTNLEAARVAIFKADAIRSFLFILLGFGALFLFAYKKINKHILLLALGILILSDMWPVNKRYLNNDNFVAKRLIEKPFQPNAANLQILKDNDPHFRVFNPDANPFNESVTSYFHKSIGGYHGAKLKRYQELIDFHLGGRKHINMKVLNMLNAKYVIRIVEGIEPVALINQDALGNAWFVENINFVANADEEILALDDFEPEGTVIIDNRFKSYLDGFNIKKDTTAFIKLTSYQPNKLTYQSISQWPQLAVFSEVYYPDGWEVFVNGKKSEHIRANYILRAMIIPAGNNEIIFEFKPKSYYTGEKISLAFSVLLVLIIIAGIISNFKNIKKS